MFFFKKKSDEERKQEIYKKFMENKKISGADIKFMKKNDWHPIDELNVSPETVVKLKKIATELKNEYK